MTKILILGDARHGKDTMAEMLCDKTELKLASSSRTAVEIFLFDILNKKYKLNYSTIEEAWQDRVNYRKIWFDEICLYNTIDRLKLVKDILNIADIYVGLRNQEEVEQAILENSFDHIIGVFNYRLPREGRSSNTADVFRYSSFVIMNNGNLDDLNDKVINILLKIIL